MTYAIEGASHRFVGTNGVTLSVYEAGEGRPDRPAVVLCHGFPELAYTWRHQIPALAGAGFRVLAPDQRGYGGSSRPEAVADYDIFHLTGDLVGLLDEAGIERAVFVGHDWGGFVVWQMPLLHPDRVAGVVGLNTPYLPRLPIAPTEAFRMVGGEDHYIVYFQQPGVADAALAERVELVFDRMLRTAVDPVEVRARTAAGTGFVAMLEAEPLGEPLLPPSEQAVYVDTFRSTGFTGGLNWYRNFDRNWELTPEQDGARIDGIPCLMLTAEWDPVLAPALAQGMPAMVGDLELHELAHCGHWTQQEQPEVTNRLIVDWLTRRFG